MRKELQKNLTLVSVIIVSMALFVNNGVAFAGIFIVGVILGTTNNFLRSRGNEGYFLKKSIGIAMFLGLYVVRILLPVILGVIIIKSSVVLGIIFLVGFSTQFAYIVEAVNSESNTVKEN